MDHLSKDSEIEVFENEYEVEHLVGARWSKHGWEYQVHWVGFRSDSDTWEPEHHLTNYGSADLVDRFWEEWADKRDSCPALGTEFHTSDRVKQLQDRRVTHKPDVVSKRMSRSKTNKVVRTKPSEERANVQSGAKTRSRIGSNTKGRPTQESPPLRLLASHQPIPALNGTSNSLLYPSPTARTPTKIPKRPTEQTKLRRKSVTRREGPTSKSFDVMKIKEKQVGQTKEVIGRTGRVSTTTAPSTSTPSDASQIDNGSLDALPMNMLSATMNQNQKPFASISMSCLKKTGLFGDPSSPLSSVPDDDEWYQYTVSQDVAYQNKDSSANSVRRSVSTVEMDLDITVTSDCPDSGESSATSILIGRDMVQSEVITHLREHGCQDLTNELDLASSSNFPVAHGGFGDVFKATLRDGTQVAIKTTRVYITSVDEVPKHIKRAARELHTWAKCDHPSVLRLLGLVIFRDQIGMVSPWMEEGSLPSYLSRRPKANRYYISTQVSEGLAYLHSKEIIHGDLKGLNVLMSNSGVPLLTDFGNAILENRTLQFTSTSAQPGLSLRWSAPEILNAEIAYSTEADVYALGMTILETLTSQVPYREIKRDLAVVPAVLSYKIPARPHDAIPVNNRSGDKLWGLLTSCWLRDPNARPSAELVARTMSNVVEPTPLSI